MRWNCGYSERYGRLCQINRRFSSRFAGESARAPSIGRKRLSVINRHVRHVARTHVFRARANEFVVGVLFQDVRRPTADAANREDGSVEIQRNSHHVVSRS